MVDRTPLLAVFLLLVLAPASGSLVEDATGGAISYQFDGDSHHDAPDACGDATERHALALGNRTDGLLVPVEDEADHFLLPVNASAVGGRVRVDAVPARAGFDVRVDVSVPGCKGSVLDAVNQPLLPVEDPVPGEGQKLVEYQDGDPVCSDRWFWVLNQVGRGQAPPAIHVTWTDGSHADVLLEKASGGVAQYATTAHPNVTVLRATAVVDEDWTGRFILSEGFCDAEDGGAVFGEPARRISDTILEFTAIGAGPHVVSVVYVPQEPELPSAVPVSCHQCLAGLEAPLEPLFYDLVTALS